MRVLCKHVEKIVVNRLTEYVSAKEQRACVITVRIPEELQHCNWTKWGLQRHSRR